MPHLPLSLPPGPQTLATLENNVAPVITAVKMLLSSIDKGLCKTETSRVLCELCAFPQT